MINLVEGAARQKTPNEIALNTLLIVLSLSFLVVVVKFISFYAIFRREFAYFMVSSIACMSYSYNYRGGFYQL